MFTPCACNIAVAQGTYNLLIIAAEIDWLDTSLVFRFVNNVFICWLPTKYRFVELSVAISTFF